MFIDYIRINNKCQYKNMDFFKLVAEVGFPIAAAISAGYFVFLTVKFILAGVTSSIKSLSGIITGLDNRVKTMNHDVIRIDTLMSSAMGVKPDIDRIARADGKTDARKD
jgi:archaellum biogenesis ATPase FlaH